MKKPNLEELINEEIKVFFQSNPYSLKDKLIMENEIRLGELLNPDDSYDYWGSKNTFKYEDYNKVIFFVTLTYQPTNEPFFELKTGWMNKEGKAQYEPSIPPVSPNSSAIDWDKRSNTVAKIYRDELLPFFDGQKLSDRFVINPISTSRMKFSERLINKFTPKDKYNIFIDSTQINVIKK